MSADAEDLDLHCYPDANFGRDGGKSTTGVQLQVEGPGTCFPISAVSVKQTAVSHCTPESEVVALAHALRAIGIPALAIWEIMKGRKAEEASSPADDGPLMHAMLGTKARERIKKSGSEDRNRTRLVKKGGFLKSKTARLIFHEDNTAMISVCKNGRNPTMRWLGRVHGISINFLHQEVKKPYVLLGHIASEHMAGDIHTKSFGPAEAAVWNRARQNINVISKDERHLIGQPGPGYINLAINPQKYARPETQRDPWEDAEAPAMVAVGSQPHHANRFVLNKFSPKRRREGDVDFYIGADCAGWGSGVEGVLSVIPNAKIKFATESEDHAREHLFRNFRIQEVNDPNILNRPAASCRHADLYVCGFPCQEYSQLGKQQGARPKRRTSPNALLSTSEKQNQRHSCLKTSRDS